MLPLQTNATAQYVSIPLSAGATLPTTLAAGAGRLPDAILYICPGCNMKMALRKLDRRDERLWLLGPDCNVIGAFKPEGKAPTVHILTCANCTWSSELHENGADPGLIYKGIRDANGYNSNWHGLPAQAIRFPRPEEQPHVVILRPWPTERHLAEGP